LRQAADAERPQSSLETRYIVREPDRHKILVRSSGLALGVDALYEGDRVAFDVDMGPTRRRAT
jgi:cold shock CspA family protein